MNLTLIRGLPGSGKSTLASSFGCLHLEADMWHQRNGAYSFDGTKARTAHEWCQSLTLNALGLGIDVVVSNTFTQKWELEPYLSMGKKFGAKIEIIRLTKNYGSIHSVPEESIRKMVDRWEDIDGEVIK